MTISIRIIDVIALDELNRSTREVFVERLGEIYEHSPWVPDAAYDRRPFATRNELHAAMEDAVSAAGPQRRLALLRAHPELAGRAAERRELTGHSTREQRGSGLLDCSPEELGRLRALNAEYAEKFGVPFIIAVKGLDRAAILAALERRIGNRPDEEIAEALRQVGRIAALRLDALIGE